jgi:hypothetical protein
MRAKAFTTRKRLAMALIASALLAGAAPAAVPLVGGPAAAVASNCGGGTCGP